MGRRSLQFDAVADLEGTSFKDGVPGKLHIPKVVCGAIYTGAGEVFTLWNDDARLFDALLGLRGVVWWHSGSRYDLRWLVDRCMDRGIRPQLDSANRGKITAVHVGHAVHRDSMSLWPTSLAEFSFGTPFPKARLGLRCVCADACDGYCAIRADVPPPIKRRIIQRCAADCLSLWAGLERLAEEQEGLDIDGCTSIGSSAWHSVRRRYHLPRADESLSRHLMIREAYLPGRAEVVRIESPRAEEYDRSMCYAAIYGGQPMPWGEPARLYPEEASEAWRRKRPGVYTATVRVPTSHLPPLAYRTPRRRVGWPTGTFRGTWVEPELRYAVDQCGVEVQQVHSAQVYDSQRVILREWSEFLWTERAGRAQAKDPTEGYVKALAVALSGVFGSSPFAEDVVFDPKPKEVKVCPCQGKNGPECKCRGRCCPVSGGCYGDCGAWTAISLEHGIWSAPRLQILDRAHVIWAAYINGYARVALHQQATLNDGGDDVIHLGTDGLLCEGSRPIGPPGIGAWRHQRTVERVRLSYAHGYEATDAKTGEVLTRASGASRESASRLLRGEQTMAWRPVGLREGLRTGSLFAGRMQPRQLAGVTKSGGLRWYGVRVAVGKDTRAPTAEELERLAG